ncbi:hypothetical protein FRX31_006077 [Thalictrum thalictroides]|uniref:Uncharacterized protein n=1 Tax=Thalictrum thalictroides TaxID=46969 RepID=A0A7J6X6Z6_THATH|nr:hypothetical protein FRX31_006077 [Thalictrum thalictroides]
MKGLITFTVDGPERGRWKYMIIPPCGQVKVKVYTKKIGLGVPYQPSSRLVYNKIAADDPEQVIDQIPPVNGYARLFQLVVALKEKVRANRKAKGMVVSQDLERIGNSPLANEY